MFHLIPLDQTNIGLHQASNDAPFQHRGRFRRSPPFRPDKPEARKFHCVDFRPVLTQSIETASRVRQIGQVSWRNFCVSNAWYISTGVVASGHSRDVHYAIERRLMTACVQLFRTICFIRSVLAKCVSNRNNSGPDGLEFSSRINRIALEKAGLTCTNTILDLFRVWLSDNDSTVASLHSKTFEQCSVAK